MRATPFLSETPILTEDDHVTAYDDSLRTMEVISLVAIIARRDCIIGHQASFTFYKELPFVLNRILVCCKSFD